VLHHPRPQFFPSLRRALRLSEPLPSCKRAHEWHMPLLPPGDRVRYGRGALRVVGKARRLGALASHRSLLARSAISEPEPLSSMVLTDVGSYQDALLSRAVSVGNRAALDDVGLKLSQRLSCQHRKKHGDPVSSPPHDFTTVTKVGKFLSYVNVICVVMCHLQVPILHSLVTSPLWAHYLAVVTVRCLNCLTSSHRRADCHLLTWCFNYHDLHHHRHHL
jgi:hypothetical protein